MKGPILPGYTESSAALNTGQAHSMQELRGVFLALIAQGVEIQDLSMLNPDLPPPRIILDKLLEATIKGDNHRYAVSRGIRKLRGAFSEKYRSRFSVSLNPESEICVTFGTKDALLQTLLVLGERLSVSKRRLLIGQPAYPAYGDLARLSGWEPHYFPLVANEDRMLSNIARALTHSDYGAILLNFPNNPTGMSVSVPFYEKVLCLAEEADCLLINDFVYGEMTYGDRVAPSMLSVPGAERRGIESYSLSKAYSVPGWRVGAILGNSEIVAKVAARKAITDYGLFLPIQTAASFALSTASDIIGQNIMEYRSRASIVHGAISRFPDGWKCDMPEAGASAWIQMPAGLPLDLHAGVEQDSSFAFAEKCLREARVLVMPGKLFGSSCDSCIRIALVQPAEKLRNALERMKRLVQEVTVQAAA